MALVGSPIGKPWGRRLPVSVGGVAPFQGADTVMDFANGYYRREGIVYGSADAVPNLTYTRTGAATAWRSDGTLVEFAPNVLRRTDAGVTIEGQRTNLMPRWDPTAAQIVRKAGCTDADAPVVAPLAGRNWIALDNSSATAFLYQVGPDAASTIYTISVFVETVDGSQPVAGTTTTSGDFGFVVAGGLVVSSATYRKVAGNIWLVSVTTTTNATPASTSAGIVRYDTQPKRPLKFSGFQLEQASTPSSPIITTGAAATVGADNLALAKTIAAGEDFTVVESADLAASAPAVGEILFGWGNTTNGFYVLRNSSDAVSLRVFVAGTQTIVGTATKTGPRRLSAGVRRAGSAWSVVFDGGTISSSNIPGMPNLGIGSIGGFSGSNPIFGPIRQTTLFPFALTDAELVELTR